MALQTDRYERRLSFALDKTIFQENSHDLKADKLVSCTNA